MGGEGSMSHANSSLKSNRSMRQHGRGLFGRPKEAALEGSNKPFQLPTPTKSTRERFAEEARAHQRRERTVWATALTVTLLLAYLYYVWIW